MCYNEEMAWEKAELQEELEAGFIDYDEYENELNDIEESCKNYYDCDW